MEGQEQASVVEVRYPKRGESVVISASFTIMESHQPPLVGFAYNWKQWLKENDNANLFPRTSDLIRSLLNIDGIDVLVVGDNKLTIMSLESLSIDFEMLTKAAIFEIVMLADSEEICVEHFQHGTHAPRSEIISK